MRTWSEIQRFIDTHKLPCKVQRFNMSLHGVLVDAQTDAVLANTVKDAAKYLQTARPTLTAVTDSGSRILISEDDSPELYEQFRIWRSASSHSLAEHAAWERLIDLANAHLEDELTDDFVSDIAVTN